MPEANDHLVHTEKRHVSLFLKHLYAFVCALILGATFAYVWPETLPFFFIAFLIWTAILFLHTAFAFVGMRLIVGKQEDDKLPEKLAEDTKGTIPGA